MPPNALITLTADNPPPNNLAPIQEGIAILTFFLCWLLIARSWPIFPVGRNAAAILGGCIMVTIGAITAEQAFASISGGTILLLSGLMLILGRLEDKGLIPWLKYVLLLGSPTPQGLLIRVSLASGFFAGLIMNDGSAIFLTGVIISICEENDLEVEPFALALATSANIGSAATVIGNPKNMIIQEQIPNTSFMSFFLSMAPAAYVGTLLNTLCLCWHYRHRLPHRQLRYREVSGKRLSGRVHSGTLEATGAEGLTSPTEQPAHPSPSDLEPRPWSAYDDDDEASLRRRLNLTTAESEEDSDDEDETDDDFPEVSRPSTTRGQYTSSETSPLLNPKSSRPSISSATPSSHHDLSWAPSKPQSSKVSSDTFPKLFHRSHQRSRPSLQLPSLSMASRRAPSGSDALPSSEDDDVAEPILQSQSHSQRPIPLGRHEGRPMLPDSQYFDQGNANSLSPYSRSVPGYAGPSDSTMDPTSWLLRDVGSPRNSHYLVDPSIHNLTDSTRYPEERRHSHLEAFPSPSLPITPDALGQSGLSSGFRTPASGPSHPEGGSRNSAPLSLIDSSRPSSIAPTPRLSWHPTPSLDPIPSSPSPATTTPSSSPSHGPISPSSTSALAIDSEGVASFPPPHFHSQSKPMRYLFCLLHRWPLSLQNTLFVLIILGMYIGFAFRMHLGFTCLTAAMLILCLERRDPTRHISESINYPLLAYLFGIFVLISGVRQTRVPDGMWRLFQPLVHNGTRWIEALAFVSLICVLSFIFTSIPAVLLVSPRIDGLSGWEDQAWLLLAWSVTLCGNWTSFGSVAGLVVSELCREYSERPGSKDRWIGEFSVWVSFSWWSTLLILFSGMALIMIQ
ncbi:MAG: citrate transporter-like domain-containing protein [Piptocephalis tieghemiana]|nr:MAG: citrate transporter-like domain-containing protein [Piptocephalis tieghemiana]